MKPQYMRTSSIVLGTGGMISAIGAARVISGSGAVSGIFCAVKYKVLK
jgi:glutamate 5-kinase